MTTDAEPPPPIHPFPARMAASIPWDELRSTSRSLRVLDPMVGSGTTAVVARTLGHVAIGVDVDPLAVLLAGAWCSETKPDYVEAVAAAIVEKAQQRWRALRGPDSYPAGADAETQKFVRYWFDLTNRRQLRALADEISATRHAETRNLLWVAFSRLIIAKQGGASLALDLAHSRPHKVKKKKTLRPIRYFAGEVRRVLLAKARGGPGPRARIRQGDARNLDVPSQSIDVIVTSPPYLNAIDYLRASKFTLVWLGHSVKALRTTRSTSIGTEVSSLADEKLLVGVSKKMASSGELPTRQRRMLLRYLQDMDKVLSEMRRVLVPGGRAILVVGDCAIRGVRVSNSIGIKSLAKRHGLRLVRETRRRLPANRRYLPPPSTKSADLELRMRTEVVLRFELPL